MQNPSPSARSLPPADSTAHASHNPLRIVVATITRKRPEMLATAVSSCQSLQCPEDCQVEFLVVDNDTDTASPNIEILSRCLVQRITEARIGIPFARNAAIRHAIDRDADLLAFLDDDEMADPLWLVCLVKAYRHRPSALMGGPVYVAAATDATHWPRTSIHSSLQRRAAKKAARAAQLAAEFRDRQVTITTGNWLASTLR